jgi:hypothetical protein
MCMYLYNKFRNFLKHSSIVFKNFKNREHGCSDAPNLRPKKYENTNPWRYLPMAFFAVGCYIESMNGGSAKTC